MIPNLHRTMLSELELGVCLASLSDQPKETSAAFFGFLFSSQAILYCMTCRGCCLTPAPSAQFSQLSTPLSKVDITLSWLSHTGINKVQEP